MKLSKYEQETILLTNEEDGVWSIEKYNAPLKRRLEKFAAAYPELCRQEGENSFGGVRYRMDKKFLSLRLMSPVTEEQRSAASARAKRQRQETDGLRNRF